MGRSLEAALVFGDATAAEDTLATLGRQGQFSEATLLDSHQRHFADWRNDALVKNENSVVILVNGCFLNRLSSQSGIRGK